MRFCWFFVLSCGCVDVDIWVEDCFELCCEGEYVSVGIVVFEYLKGYGEFVFGCVIGKCY